MIPIQQHKPMKMGFPPVRINFIILVFKPMAPMAMMIKNLDSSFNGWKTEADTPTDVHTVVIMEARMKKRIKNGKIFFNE